jgi:hypothetical protein
MVGFYKSWSDSLLDLFTWVTNMRAQSAAFGFSFGGPTTHQSVLAVLAAHANFHSKSNYPSLITPTESPSQRKTIPFSCGITMQQISYINFCPNISIISFNYPGRTARPGNGRFRVIPVILWKQYFGRKAQEAGMSPPEKIWRISGRNTASIGQRFLVFS